jgi:sensor domain CHASE-containing protein
MNMMMMMITALLLLLLLLSFLLLLLLLFTANWSVPGGSGTTIHKQKTQNNAHTQNNT